MGRPPRSFHDFFGQAPIVRVLKRHIRGSKALRVPISDVLLLGESGAGKTTLGKAIAAEAGVTFRYLIADARVKRYCLDTVLHDLCDGDLLFLDELQNLSREDQMSLCAHMDAFKEAAVISNGPASAGTPDSSRRRISIVGATDRPGMLLPPLLRRFALRFYMERYDLRTMNWIAKKRASEAGILLSRKSFDAIARSSRGLPRLLGQRLDLLNRYWAPKALPAIRLRHVMRFLMMHEIDAFGLDRLDRAYLRVLGRHQEEGTSLRTLAMSLNVDPGFLVKVIEPHLVLLGFVTIDSCRRLTDQGRTFLEGSNGSNA